MRVKYRECVSVEHVRLAVEALAPKTVILDVEPMVAYWNTDVVVLNAGVQHAITLLSTVPSVQAIAFATNSYRRPSVKIITPPDIRISYEATAMKPFNVRPYRDLPLPGVVIGDQVATDGLLAYRLQFSFIRYRVAMSMRPRLMNSLGQPLKPLLFQRII